MSALIDAITTGVVRVFGNHVWLATIVISMLPLFEVKAGIPFAMDRGYSFWKALSFAMIGSAIITILLTFLFNIIINALKKTKAFKKIALSIETKIKTKSQKITDEAENKTINQQDREKRSILNFWLKFVAIVAFVAVPIPLTGVWTGTCIAVCVGLKPYQTISAVLIGNFIASTLVSLLSKLIGHELLLAIMVGIIVLVIITFIIKLIIKIVKNKREKTSEKETGSES